MYYVCCYLNDDNNLYYLWKNYFNIGVTAHVTVRTTFSTRIIARIAAKRLGIDYTQKGWNAPKCHIAQLMK